MWNSISWRTCEVCKNKKGKVKNSFSDMHLINPLLAHARTCGIPEKITNILQRCAGMRVFQTDRAITEVIIYHCCNRLPRATPRNITQKNLRCIEPAAALRRASMKWRGKKKRPKWALSWPGCLSFAGWEAINYVLEGAQLRYTWWPEPAFKVEMGHFSEMLNTMLETLNSDRRCKTFERVSFNDRLNACN